jgi:subtilisin family serine protease
MFKKFLFLFLLILVFSFAFADKFVITENNISTKSVSVENNVENNFKNKPELLDISKIKIISDNDFEKKNKSKIKTISETLDTNHIELFQSYSVPTVYADYGWNLDVTGNNVRIGIVDTGLDSSGTAVLGKDVVGRNFCSDYESSHYNCDYIHGCLVASIAGVMLLI